MFKIEQRTIKGKKSKYYSFRGTFKNDLGQSKTFSWVCTFQTDYKLAKKFVDNYENKLKQTNLVHAKIKFNTLASLKKDDDISPPSEKTKKMIDKVVDYLGNYYVQDITNKIIQREAFKCYPLDERLRKSAWSDLNQHEQEKKSSRNNSINRGFIGIASLILHYGANELKCCQYMTVNRLPILEKEPMYFTKEEVERCLASTSHYQTKLLLMFLIYTGVRLGEALPIKWEDINFDEQKPTIQFYSTKTLSKRPIPTPIHKTLLRYLAQSNERKGYIFQWREAWSNKKDGEGLYQNWRYMLEQAKVDTKKTPHKCRHTLATWLRKYAGSSVADLKEIVGWKSDKTVAIYNHMLPETANIQIGKLPDFKI
tara:strand:+ start:1308 stop:2411 length:1104 start_codon:yes stop_codon:yes gene_type:complete